ncbi:putative ABC transport system permease protein [Bacillus tianshenii]|uniref:Putative hemin transport system permease protein HrtB n=1 Tax=Sutcliffiella tianshenii TaxID=1463404 RepID=A0ABS2NUN0_9BACI|nr:ABC transporter permease [Bacillus tianshenii]MBM7618233.1 putative ABC transport system permease protein [Bacillus tianshenii]
MNILQYTLLSIKGRKLNAAFTVVALTLAVTLTFLVIMLSSGIEQGIKKQSATYDLIVGAEGSPTQLVLNSVMYLDAPIGNIPYHIYEDMKEDDRILRAVPLALGDSYYGLPIVGTTQDFFLPYREGLAERFHLADGAWFEEPGDVVLGSFVAKEANLSVGDTFTGNHGLGENGDQHGGFTYKVVGTLEPTGTADDKGIFTPIESVWLVHEEEHEEHEDAASDNEEEQHDEEHEEDELEITALMLKPQQIGHIPSLKEEMDSIHEVQAIFPVRTFRQLLETFDYGKNLAYLLTGVSIVLAGLFIVFAIISSIHQRKQETSILRSLGVNRNKILANLLLETFILSGAGTILGIVFAYLIFAGLKMISLSQFGLKLGDVGLPVEYALYAGLVFVGATSIALLPILPSYLLNRKREF